MNKKSFVGFLVCWFENEKEKKNKTKTKTKNMSTPIGGFSPSSAGFRSDSMSMRSKPQVAIEARPQQRVVGFQGTSIATPPVKKDLVGTKSKRHSMSSASQGASDSSALTVTCSTEDLELSGERRRSHSGGGAGGGVLLAKPLTILSRWTGH